MSGLLDWLSHLHGTVVYLPIAALVFAEAAIFVGFVLPGETAVVLGGVLASQHRLHLPTLLAVVVAAAIAGDSVGYQVGRHLGPRILEVRPLRRRRARLDQARHLVRCRGGPAVLAGRFVAFLRAVTPALAGLSHMRYRTFFAYNAAGGLGWGVGFTLLGYLAGSSYAQLEHQIGRGIAVALLAVALLAAVGTTVWRRRHPRGQPPNPPR